MSLRTVLAHALGLKRSMVGMLTMVVLVGMGEHMAERFLPLYLQQLTTRATAILAIGLLAWLDDFLSALYSFPGGYLTDRLGHRRALKVKTFRRLWFDFPGDFIKRRKDLIIRRMIVVHP